MSNELITVTVENIAQAQILSRINTTAGLLRGSLEQIEAEARKMREALESGRLGMSGFGSPQRNAAEYRTLLQAYCEAAGSVGLTDEQVTPALMNDYIAINRLDKD